MARTLVETSRNSQAPLQRGPAFLNAKVALFIGFAFAVMADPVSSVAYAIEAATRALGNNLSLLFPTMLVVIGIIALVIANYHQLVAIFPEGGGSAAAAGTAFGEGWAFIPLGALVVDFVLTIAVSIAAAASAIIAYFPAIAPLRMPIVSGAGRCSLPGLPGSVTGAASCSLHDDAGLHRRGRGDDRLGLPASRSPWPPPCRR